MQKLMKIAIVGAGFLGCALSLILSNKNKVIYMTNSILSGASSYNQMRFLVVTIILDLKKHLMK